MTTTPALTRDFASIPRCTTHAHALLTREGVCPTCDREGFMSRVLTAEQAREASRLQAQTRVVSGDRRRNVSAAEAARLGAA